MERFLAEGGAVGHLRHLYDNRDMTFGELKDILSAAAEGKLERVTEKLDGMNMVFTFDMQQGALKVARSGGEIKGGGLDATALAAKFKDRGNITDAFNGAFKVLHEAMAAVPDEVKAKVFGKAGTTWYSIEVIYSSNPNVINYDANWVVFHSSPVFQVKASGEVDKRDDAPGVKLLERHVDQMQAALTQRSWRVRGPAVLLLKKLSDGSVIRNAVSAIDKAQAVAQVHDDGTIGDYLRALVSEEVADLGLDEKASQAVTERCLGSEGAPGLPVIKKMVDPGDYPAIQKFVNASPALLKRAIEPIEMAVHQFAIEVLRGLHSVLVGNHEAEVQRLRSQVAAAVKAIESSGNVQAMDVLQKQMQKLGSLENIAAAMEGIVFIYKGNAYKFTGSFAPANQILGLFKYGRGGSKLEHYMLAKAVEQLHEVGLLSLTKHVTAV